MAFDKKPSSWFDNWSENGTNVTVPIATFPEMTAAEADADTGDIRKVIYALCEKIYQEYLERATSDRPGKMRVYRTTSTNDAEQITTVTYQVRFEVAISAQDVADEEI